jgi:uncharacterized OsmC-like protein
MQTSQISGEAQNKNPEVVVHGKAAGFLQEVVAGKHQFRADEPVDVGGTDAAPSPYDYLVAALGTCTSMTIGWYARKRKIPLENIKVSLWQSRIHGKDCEDCLTKDGMIHRIELEIELTGPLTKEQHDVLMQAAERCPVHRTLTSEIDIRLRSAQSSPA